MVKLEEFGIADIDRLLSWIPTREALVQWAGSGFVYPLGREQLMKHLQDEQADEDRKEIYRVVSTSDDAVVGHCELVNIDPENRSAHIALMLVAPEYRGMGYGEATVRKLLERGFGTLKVHRISLYVFDFNTTAIACYEKCGFQIEGILREAR